MAASTTSRSIILEVCVDSVESALNAVSAGADRLELCGNLGLGGGTTPSIGLFKAVHKAAPGIPIMAMVRPRVGDFVYSDCDMDVMLEDIRSFKRHGARGIVLGILTAEGTVDVERTKRLVDAALPLEICFHRAFDMTRDPMEALSAVASIGGISRILTSGHGKRVLDAVDTLVALHRAANRISGSEPWALTILPGSGVNVDTIDPILVSLLPEGLRELHMSDGMGMSVGSEHEWSVWQTDPNAVKEVRLIVDMVCERIAIA
ncbi:hypothetical protein BDZ89DRAFT_1060136 [Hymenopellis radicata]|nr:hypothetical protein BDZ89DRAFT_1060136 [Hymenopellis radicata]